MTNYKLNEDQMFADINDGIAIIINSETGIYYGMNGFGTAIFENLINGANANLILSELKKIPNISADIENSFNNFVETLVEKGLLIASTSSSEMAISIDHTIALNDEFVLSINEYNDAQELLLADPIHEVREEIGWSPEKEALNPDKEDVARRESKIES